MRNDQIVSLKNEKTGIYRYYSGVLNLYYRLKDYKESFYWSYVHEKLNDEIDGFTILWLYKKS